MGYSIRCIHVCVTWYSVEHDARKRSRVVYNSWSQRLYKPLGSCPWAKYTGTMSQQPTNIMGSVGAASPCGFCSLNARSCRGYACQPHREKNEHVLLVKGHALFFCFRVGFVFRHLPCDTFRVSLEINMLITSDSFHPFPWLGLFVAILFNLLRWFWAIGRFKGKMKCLVRHEKCSVCSPATYHLLFRGEVSEIYTAKGSFLSQIVSSAMLSTSLAHKILRAFPNVRNFAIHFSLSHPLYFSVSLSSLRSFWGSYLGIYFSLFSV